MRVAEQELENVNSRTVQLVNLLSELGPDIPEISRRLGQFKESVRYRYKEKILNRGLAVQAAVDHQKLGLKRVMLIGEVPEPYKRYSQSIFAAMHELCYVVGFAKTLIGGEHIVNLSVPEEHLNDTKAFLEGLKERGMFSKLEILEFDWVRNAPMKAEYYDFDTGRWDFDWQWKGEADFDAANFRPSAKGRFDYTDLLLIKEFQMDANKSLKEISDKLGINYKKLAWHYTTHVLARGMLPCYTVNWMGTRYDYNIEKALHRKHRYFAVELMVRNVNEFELMTLRQGLDRLPFLWGEAGGKNYYAGLVVPVDNVVEALQYLGTVTEQVRDRMAFYPIDQTEAARFTIAYQLYDPEAKAWRLNREQLEKKFEELLMQIKTEAS